VKTIGRLLLACAATIIFAAAFVKTSSAATPQKPAVVLTADESLALAAANVSDPCQRYRTRSWLRERLVRESDLQCYGLRLDDDWQQAAADRPVAILVHGFNSGPKQNAALMLPVHEQHFACGVFVYPNDHTIAESAKLLSKELKDFAVKYPRRRIALVCHSMGGIVARACLESPRLDPGNVERLIMIAPPTHGTVLAHFAVGTDLYEHWFTRRDGGPWRRMRDSVIDGLGEAADDLCPGSEFLTQLNEQQRNPRVRYSILLGTSAFMNDSQTEWIRESVREGLAKLPGASGSAERIDAMLSDIDELVEGKGDGVVAVKRGRLDGVADILVLPFGHVGVTGEPHDDKVLRQVQQIVLERLN